MSDLKEVFPNFNGIGAESDLDIGGIDNFYQIKQQIKNQIKKQDTDKSPEPYIRSSDSSYFDKLYYNKKEHFISGEDYYCQKVEEHLKSCISCYRKFYHIHPVERTNYFLSFVILVLITILIFRK